MGSTDPSRAETLTVRSLIEMLASSLGWEKSAEVVNAAVVRLGYPPVLITSTQAFALLAELAKSPGMVGVTARFARSRMESARSSSSSGGRAISAPRSSSEATPVSSVQKVPRVLQVTEIVGLLASTVGQERAEEAVNDVVGRLKLPEQALSRTETLALLDDLAAKPGLLGMTARFAKARALLLFSA